MQKSVLITGATSGIGYELTHAFATEKYNLVLVARSKEKLETIKKELEKQYQISVEVIPKDLSVKDAPEEIYETLFANNKRIDILVNSAGFGDFGDFVDSNWNKQYSMIQLNIVAVIHMTRLFLKPMVERGNGKILNLASTAAFQPVPFQSIYAASKAFILSYSEALSKELKDSGVTVTALCPGATQTAFYDVASLQNSKAFKTLKVAQARDVASYGYRELMKGRPVVIHGFINRLLTFIIRFIPRNLTREISYRITKKVN